MATSANSQQYRSYWCRNLYPPKETTIPQTPMTTIPAVSSMLPSETAERVDPPSTQETTPNPAIVQRFSATIMDTR